MTDPEAMQRMALCAISAPCRSAACCAYGRSEAGTLLSVTMIGVGLGIGNGLSGPPGFHMFAR